MEFPSDKVALTRMAELIGDEDVYQNWAMNLILAALVDTSFLGERGNKPRLTNDDVMKLVVSGISEDVIVRIIEMYEGDYEISQCIVSLAKQLCRRQDPRNPSFKGAPIRI